MTGSLLAARRLACGYRGVPVLRDVDLDMGPGCLTVIVGPNGSGKTTLLRTLAGLLAPLSGEALMADRQVASFSVRERARLVAFVPQLETPVPGYTVFQTAEAGRFARLGWFSAQTRADVRAVSAALSAVGLGGDSERPATELSGGEFRRLLIARALAQETPALLLDEPEAHLDAGHQAEILSLLSGLAKFGKAVIATIHDLNLASLWADRVAVLAEGKLLASGIAAEVLTEETVERAYHAGLIPQPHPRNGRPQFLHRAPEP
jgi:iron complex transport system ATP-binding protein